ncbi:MAG: 5-oxoprolinase subunit PxpA, partial [Thermoanaerobaculia bacterium]
GDEASMRAAAAAAARFGVVLGAHPSYPDRLNFGRVSLAIDPVTLEHALAEQIAALREIARATGLALTRVKPHGALYNDAHRDRTLADVIVRAMRRAGGELALVASDRSQMAAAARDAGVDVVREAFADRRYRADGSLSPRSEPGSLLTIDESAVQAGHLATDGFVAAGDGTRVAFAFDTLCIHADMEQAVERLMAIRQRLGMATEAG